MTSTKSSFNARVKLLAQAAIQSTLPGIQHGVEREALRINPNGSLAQTPHPRALGSALTHDSITTDFSESLLEFITPPEANPNKTMDQLRDIHKYVLDNLGEERLWPLSMPCYITDEETIPIAQYGDSNIGKMKTLYRIGLKNRYGSMMQAIAGVHFNFSLPQGFWEQWLPASENQAADKDSISAAYFGMIRNYRRFCWLIPYLFGASPALCGSFIKDKTSSLPFKKLGKGTYYLPYATSLRMSDLGYTNSAQSGLYICYNKVPTYIESLRRAINTPSTEYAKFEGKKDGQYQQLNANVLQIENELYSPIRPKQPTLPLEKPTDALDARGVSYIEVRALDINPFSDVGIDLEQFYFLDVFLLYCLIAPSGFMDNDEYMQTEANLGAIVTDGRDPELTLARGDEHLGVRTWAGELFEQMREVAKSLDAANGHQSFSESLEKQWQKILNPDLTPSGTLLNQLLSDGQDNGAFGVQMADEYRTSILARPYRRFDAEHFSQQAETSLSAQQEKEQSDAQSFDEFLDDYFSDLDGTGDKQNYA